MTVDPGSDPLYPSSRVLRLARRLPLLVRAEPERVVLNIAFAVIGVGAVLANEPGSILDAWPLWLLVAWTMAMAGGGWSVLWGITRRRPTIERLGYVLVGPACFAYAVGAVWVRGWAGLPVAIIFVGLALVKGLRLLLSVADRDLVTELDVAQKRADCAADPDCEQP